MKSYKHYWTLLLGIVLLLSFGLLGCTDESYDSTEEWEMEESTDQSIRTITEVDTESSEEYVTETVETDWDGCVITTDEIGYEPGQTYLDEDGYYTTEIDVATYLIEYHTLPNNFITKKEAKKKGWEGGSLKEYGEELCIGGDYFGNYEGNLPQVKGRSYYECDIDTMGAKKRGAKRIIYSDDGQIYYTDDHYENFTLIYGSDQ